MDASKCKDLEDYNKKFWKALLPVTSYRIVPLTEQIEKYCCGLPKELRNYCTKTKVTTLTQLIENANTGNALLLGVRLVVLGAAAKRANQPEFQQLNKLIRLMSRALR